MISTLAWVGWQELLSMAIVGLAVLMLVRRGAGGGGGGCGTTCSGGSCSSGDPERQPTIRTLHEIRVTPTAPDTRAEQPDSCDEPPAGPLSANRDKSADQP